MTSGSGQGVVPSLAPVERRLHEIGEVDPVEQVVERPPGRGMSDDEDPRALEPGGEVGEEPVDSGDDVPIALAIGERIVDPA